MLLQFQIKEGSSFEDLLNHPVLSQYIDKSNLKDHKLKDDSFKGKEGYLKYETADNIITSAVLLKPKLNSIETVGGRKMAAKGVSMRNIDPIPHKKFEEILEDFTVSVIRPQTTIRKIGEHMCTVTTNKETINAFENKRWWDDAFNSHGYGHQDIKHLPGGSDCKPVRFENVVEPTNNAPAIYVGVDDGRTLDNDLLDDDDLLEEDDDDDVLLAAACADAEKKLVSNVFNNSLDFEGLRDLVEVEDLFSVPFEDLEDSAVAIESDEDLDNDQFEELFNISFDDLDESMAMPESSNLKRKSDNDQQSQHKRVKQN